MLLSIVLPLIEPCRILSTEKHTLPEPFPEPLLSTPQTPPSAQICLLVDYCLDGHDFEQTLGVGEGQESLTYCSPWGHKELDITERLN